MTVPQIPDHEFWYEFSHSSGPGGQHVNKTSSKVTLCFAPENSSVLDERQKRMIAHRLRHRITKEGILRVHCEAERSQYANKQRALEKLRTLLGEALIRRKRRVATKPSRGAKERRIKAKKIRSAVKKLRGKPPTDGTDA